MGDCVRDPWLGPDDEEVVMDDPDLILKVRQYLSKVEERAPTDEIMAFYAPDAEQVEFPNQLMPKGLVRDLAALREADANGRKVLRAQTYDVRNALVQGNCVVIEASWTGVLAIPLGSLAAGDTMKAHFAQVFEFENGLIKRQRNYDCFETA